MIFISRPLGPKAPGVPRTSTLGLPRVPGQQPVPKDYIGTGCVFYPVPLVWGINPSPLLLPPNSPLLIASSSRPPPRALASSCRYRRIVVPLLPPPRRAPPPPLLLCVPPAASARVGGPPPRALARANLVVVDVDSGDLHAPTSSSTSTSSTSPVVEPSSIAVAGPPQRRALTRLLHRAALLPLHQ